MKRVDDDVPAAPAHDRPSEGPWQTLLLEVDGPVGLLTINRPDHLNVMNLPMRRELAAVLGAVRADDRIKVLVITAAGDAFCAGGDVNDFVGRGSEAMHELMRETSHLWFRALWNLPIPTVVAVNGVAAGGGINMVLACDMVLASTAAQFGQTFAKVGLMPDLGGVFLLPRAIGLHRAKAMCLTAELIDAEQAHELGFVSEVLEPDALLPRALELARTLAAGPQAAFTAAKMALNRSFEMSMEQTLQLELYAQSFLFATDTHRERLHDFLDGGATEQGQGT